MIWGLVFNDVLLAVMLIEGRIIKKEKINAE
jgi:hypothetical protein